jgi:signal recognition particle subunit SRP54
MGDILSLIEKAEQNVDKKKAEEMASRALTGDGFSLEDFRDQLRQLKKMGSIQSLMGMLPSVGPFAGIQKHADKVDEKQLGRVEAIINSMTQHERLHHEVMNGSRRKRIARGSGTACRKSITCCASTPRCERCSSKSQAQLRRRMAGMKMPGM